VPKKDRNQTVSASITRRFAGIAVDNTNEAIKFIDKYIPCKLSDLGWNVDLKLSIEIEICHFRNRTGGKGKVK
jgi:hypothetical protein